MNCKECKALLEEYLDQELDPEIAGAVSLHLATCEPCCLELNSLSGELAVYQRYDSAIEVSDELWSRIENRLVPATVEKASWLSLLRSFFSAPRVSLPATVALVLISVGLTVVVMKRSNSFKPEILSVSSDTNVDKQKQTMTAVVESEPEKERISPAAEKEGIRANTPIVRSTRLSNREAAATPDQVVRSAEKKYLAAITMLSRDVARRHAQLDSDTRMKLEQALASIDRTIAATRRVVRQHPNDPLAAQYMLGAYARKVDALREMAGGGGL